MSSAPNNRTTVLEALFGVVPLTCDGPHHIIGRDESTPSRRAVGLLAAASPLASSVAARRTRSGASATSERRCRPRRRSSSRRRRSTACRARACACRSAASCRRAARSPPATTACAPPSASSDDDCDRVPESPCITGFTCGVAVTVGPFCCRKFCICKDYVVDPRHRRARDAEGVRRGQRRQRVLQPAWPHRQRGVPALPLIAASTLCR